MKRASSYFIESNPILESPCYYAARASPMIVRKARAFFVMTENFFSFTAFLSTSSPPTPSAAAPAWISPITMATDLLGTGYHGRKLMGIYHDSLIPMQARMVKAIHDAGGEIFCQLASFGGKYGGRAAHSCIYSPNYIHKPDELTNDEIWQIIEGFGQSARRAREVGYDGIDIHGCHSYLIGQFTSPALNKRTDQWGGSFEKRMKFPMEVYKCIKDAVGEDFPIGVKLSTWEDFAGGIRMEEAARIAKRWADAGILYINASSTNATIERLSPYPSVPSSYIKRNTLIPLTKNVKGAVRVTGTLVAGTGAC